MQNKQIIDFEALIRGARKVVRVADSVEFFGILDCLEEQVSDPDISGKFHFNRVQLLDSFLAGRFYVLKILEEENDSVFMNGREMRKLDYFIPQSWNCFKAFCTTYKDGGVNIYWSDNLVQSLGMEKLFRQMVG